MLTFVYQLMEMKCWMRWAFGLTQYGLSSPDRQRRHLIACLSHLRQGSEWRGQVLVCGECNVLRSNARRNTHSGEKWCHGKRTALFSKPGWFWVADIQTVKSSSYKVTFWWNLGLGGCYPWLTSLKQQLSPYISLVN